jgi:hypothetical protein
MVGGWTAVLWNLLLAVPPPPAVASSHAPGHHEYSSPQHPLLYYADAWVAAFYDPYAKAGRHLLLMLRPQHGGPPQPGAGGRPQLPATLTDPLLSPTAEAPPAAAEWRRRLAHLHAVGRVIAARFESDIAPVVKHSVRGSGVGESVAAADAVPTAESTATVQCGYHALPSLQPLHLHLMTRDFAAAAGGGPLKTAAQYATFQPPFFIPAAVVAAAQARGVAITVARTHELAAMAGLGPDHKPLHHNRTTRGSSGASDAPPQPAPGSRCCYCGREVGPFRAVMAHLRTCPRSPFVSEDHA